MTLLQPTDLHSSSAISYLTHAFKTKAGHYNLLSTKTLQAIANKELTPFILTLFQQQRFNQLEDLNIAISSKYHTLLYQCLSENTLENLIHISIHDLTDDGYIMSPEKDHMLLFKFLSNTLSKSQCTLKTLDIASFPSNVLLEGEYQFPHVTSLTIALMANQQQDETQYWRKLKRMFPNLIELRLNLPLNNLLLFKYLLNDLPLFPWIKRLSIQSIESPKNYLSREELRTSLVQLNGLNRITAGWDMIALN